MSDILSVAMVRTLRHGPPRGQFRPWMAQVLLNVVIDRFKAKRRVESRLDRNASFEVVSSGRDPLQECIEFERAEQLRARLDRELARWPAEVRLAHELREQNRTWAEIMKLPEFAGVALDTLRQRVTRCRRRLDEVQLWLTRELEK